VDAERSLRDAVGARHGPPETIMLNVTSGNLLMRLAADAVARVFPNVVLVYRDINALPFLFTRIDYQQFPHKVGTYEGHKAALDGLDADFLFGRQKYEAGSVEATAEEFLKAVRPNDT